MPWARKLTRADETAQRKREAILKEAARAFNRKGYAATNLDEIAATLGVTKPALYRYVKDKEDLLLACHQLSLDLAAEGIERAEQTGGPADVRLKTALSHLIEGLTSELSGCVMLLERGALSEDKERALIKKRDAFEHKLRAIVKEGIGSGVFVHCDPRVAVLTMLGAINWITKWHQPQGTYPPEELATIIAEQLIRGILAKHTGKPIIPEK